MPLPEQTLRKWLKDRREDAELTQSDVDRETQQLGPRFRVSQSYLSQIEKGTRPFTDLKPEKMDALRRLYGVSREEWISMTGVVLMTPQEAAEAEMAEPLKPTYEIPEGLREAIKLFGDEFPAMRTEPVKRNLSLARYYEGPGPQTPQEWLAYYLSIAKWIQE